MTRTCLITLLSVVGLATSAAAQPSPGVLKRPEAPAPAFQPGMRVIDSSGAVVGTFETLTSGPVGPLAVLQIDSKPVAVPQATLRLHGQQIVSTRSKAEILAAARVPQ